MKTLTLVKKTLPQNPDIEVLLPNYKEPMLAVNHGGFGWYGLMAYNVQGQLMCHECGKFWDALGHHIHKHGLGKREYRIKYGLLVKTKLQSEALHMTQRLYAIHFRTDLDDILKQARAKPRQPQNYTGDGKKTLEFQNRHDTCPSQLLRWLSEAIELYGINITEREARMYRLGLVELLRRRYGSFNEAKRLIRAVNNKQHGNPKYSKDLLLGDMIAFYRQYGRWPTGRDYYDGKMPYSWSPIYRNGGIRALRQEAMKLREEQEARRIKGEQIPQYANNIELETAGYARK